MITEKFIKEIDWKTQTFETEEGIILPFVNEEINVNNPMESADGVVYVYKGNKKDETN